MIYFARFTVAVRENGTNHNHDTVKEVELTAQGLPELWVKVSRWFDDFRTSGTTNIYLVPTISIEFGSK